jgi:hypothetical protein
MGRVVMETNYFYAKAQIDDRCVDLLLTEAEITRAFSRAKENPSLVDDTRGYSELCCQTPTEKRKCNIWDKLLGNCDCK